MGLVLGGSRAVLRIGFHPMGELGKMSGKGVRCDLYSSFCCSCHGYVSARRKVL